jgi:hypothetical protein
MNFIFKALFTVAASAAGRTLRSSSIPLIKSVAGSILQSRRTY